MTHSFGGWIRRVVAAGVVVAAASLALAGGALADAPANPGTFVIGDQNVQMGSQVTFWGAQWWKDNPLSTGLAPASFKGFAVDATAVCGPSAARLSPVTSPRSRWSRSTRVMPAIPAIPAPAPSSGLPAAARVAAS